MYSDWSIGVNASRTIDDKENRKNYALFPFINLLIWTFYCFIVFFAFWLRRMFCILTNPLLIKVNKTCLYNFNAVIVCIANKREYYILTK